MLKMAMGFMASTLNIYLRCFQTLKGKTTIGKTGCQKKIRKM
jgi:hypothetical protein